MHESSPEWAFLIGLISAASLPIGAITARLWVPTDRQIAFLMAFGGGALLAAAGNILFVGTAPAALAFVQGIAAGAMLTMIAQTMLPEAYFKGGTIIGLATMLGFLAAILSKTLE
ncbi:MAG: hypothetical protein MUE59_04350 [Thiobacillaceae bacterium]|jgi:zinc transporter ZupT|nr:hypothetical protein [Thiobacillaceae bacterium]